MDTSVVWAIAMTFLYIAWLLAYIFIVEAWLRRFTGWLLGLTIERELRRTVGQPEIIDIFFAFRWNIVEPAGVGIRILVGFLRLIFWTVALLVPIATVIAIYLRSK